MTPTVCVLSPAKVNLYLDVKRELRPDGYHEVRTVFQALDLHDLLDLTSQAAGVTLRCDDPRLPTGPENLVVRAAEAFLEGAGVSAGVALTLRKVIPVMGGLGGGSSNAAATLLGLRRLFETKHTDGELAEMAGALGSDVAFFLAGGTQLGTGRGEELAPVVPALAPWMVVVRGAEGSSTPRVYAEFDREGTEAPWSLEDALARFRKGDWGALWNSLEAPAIRCLPSLGRSVEALREAGALGALVSGSGACAFGIFASEARARQAEAGLRRSFPFARACRALGAGVRALGDPHPPGTTDSLGSGGRRGGVSSWQ